MGVFQTILIALEAICSLALIVVVLLQESKEDGLSGALSGSGETYLGKNKNGSKQQVLSSATKWIGIVWVVLTLSLSLF